MHVVVRFELILLLFKTDVRICLIASAMSTIKGNYIKQKQREGGDMFG